MTWPPVPPPAIRKGREIACSVQGFIYTPKSLPHGRSERTVYSTRRRGDTEEGEAKSRPESAEEAETLAPDSRRGAACRGSQNTLAESAGLWGRLATCGGLITRLPPFANGRPGPAANRRARKQALPYGRGSDFQPACSLTFMRIPRSARALNRELRP